MRGIFKFNLVAAACALTTLAAFAVDASSRPVKLDGWISESQCKADHAGKGADPACVAKCIKEGGKPVFVDANNQVWAIDNPDAIKDHYGHHVLVTAIEDKTGKQVHITKVSMLAQNAGSGKPALEHK